MTSLSRARLLAVMVPFLLLGGAIGSQYLGGLIPCEMCMWQRWPHLAAILLALAAIALRGRPAPSRALTIVAALAIMASGAIGVLHAGVEYHWWQGITGCSTTATLAGSTEDMLKAIMAAPIVRCDQPQWALWGISLAGWNALFSLASGVVILWLTAKRR